jgi:hypothetical protein
MKRKIIIFVILGLVILGLATYGYLRATPEVKDRSKNRPQIKITPQSFDFGEIEYGAVAEHTFEVKNLGTETLEIEKVATSCACTDAKVTPKKIASEEEAELEVIYDTGAMSGSHAKGEQERIIYIKSNDPVNPQAEVTIHAYVN